AHHRLPHSLPTRRSSDLAPFVYVRGHGPGGSYRDAYPDAELDSWAAHISDWRGEGRDVFAYFDNDIGCAAPSDAQRLRSRLTARSEEHTSELQSRGHLVC